MCHVAKKLWSSYVYKGEEEGEREGEGEEWLGLRSGLGLGYLHVIH